MPSTVYKGDLAEVTMGRESGLYLEHDYHTGLVFTLQHETADSSALIFTSGAAGYFDANSKLLYPTNMLVGARLIIIGGGNFTDDDFESTGREYTIIANSADSIRVSPQMKEATATASTTGDAIVIPPFGVPSIDVTNSVNTPIPSGIIVDGTKSANTSATITTRSVTASSKFAVGDDLYNQAGARVGTITAIVANNPTDSTTTLSCLNAVTVTDGNNLKYLPASDATSQESLLTDQFIGIAATVALPETKVDLKRYHVVGVGRDVVVQAPGKFTNEGGSMELMLNSPRWLHYCLGKTASIPSSVTGSTSASALVGAHSAGQNYIDCDMGSKVTPDGTTVAVGDYVYIADTDPSPSGTDGNNLLPVHQHKEDDLSAADSGNLYFGHASVTHDAPHADATVRAEVRRIIAVDAVAKDRIYLDAPLSFSHVTGIVVNFLQYLSGSASDSPDIASTREITNKVDHLIFSQENIPSFALETSIRTRNVGAYAQEDTSNAPGSSTDTKTLTRVFRGCKVKDWSLSADTDAALKLGVNFDAAVCYTDTGRLNGISANRGDRFTAHRMFENTANTTLARKEAGISQYAEKPYFFYNGTLSVGGISVAQVTNFTLSGSTGVTYHHTIRGTPAASTTGLTGAASNVLSTEQVPFGGSRNATLAVEGKQTFDLGLEVIVDDPIFWHHMRTTTEFNDTTGAGADGIVLKLQKQGSGAVRERITIIIDDFFITEAPLPIPEDKGVLRSSLKIAPKHVRILATDATYDY